MRIGRIDDEFVVNPSLEALEESTLDLIVVGTPDALTMVEAGADQVPEETILEAFELAHAEIRKICEALEDLRSQVGKPKWVDVELTAELEAAHGQADPLGDRRARAARGGRHGGRARQRGLARDLDGDDRGRHRPLDVRSGSSFASILEKARMEAVEGPLREQFLSDLQELTDAEQDSKELRSAKRDLLFERIHEGLELPFPVGPVPAEGSRRSRTR